MSMITKTPCRFRIRRAAVLAAVPLSGLALHLSGGCSLDVEGVHAGQAPPNESSSNGPSGAGSSGDASSSDTTGGNTNVTPKNCLEVLKYQPNATDGFYEIDPDGAGSISPFQAKCLMSVKGGGFTRFHWVTGDYPKDADPLGESLDKCDSMGPTCLARIPSVEKPTDLLIREVKSQEYAHFIFDNTALSLAVLGALRDKKEYCLANAIPAFMPVDTTSAESYCSNGNKGGCDFFIYSSSTSCHNAQAWVLELDDDGYYCQAAFKFGYSLEPSGSGCGDGDHGYMDACNCSKEDGEMYYR